MPLFWFRLAALTNASVMTDALSAPAKPDEFLKWAIQQIGSEYVWHTVVDRREAPRWEPDWISPEQLYSELIGRCWNSVHLLPESKRPGHWVKLLTKRIAAVAEGGQTASPFFPGPLDDFVEVLATDRNPAFLDVEQRLKTAGSIDETKGLVGLLYLDRPSPEVANALIGVIERAREELLAGTEREAAFLDSCARLSAVTRSLPLAAVVIDECVRLVRFSNPSLKRMDNLLRSALTACAASDDSDKHRALIGETATKFAYAFSSNKKAGAHLVTIFDSLGRRDAKLIASLGRASAVNQASVLGVSG